jgi:hypothetical protein
VSLQGWLARRWLRHHGAVELDVQERITDALRAVLDERTLDGAMEPDGHQAEIDHSTSALADELEEPLTQCERASGPAHLERPAPVPEAQLDELELE